MKHKLKMTLRAAWARLLYHTGLHVVLSQWMPRRLTIVTSHCLRQASNDFLPEDMKMSAERVELLLDQLGKRYDWVSVGEGWRRLQERRGRSMLVLSMDDGYRDNLDILLPILTRRGLSATVYLESRPLHGKQLNWTHKFFWLLGRMDHASFVKDYVASSSDEKARSRLQEVLQGVEAQQMNYSLKKVLKYEADQADVERTLTGLFEQQEGDEAALCAQLYLSWEDAEQLLAGGVELGGHTVTHPVLSGLEDTALEAEIAGGKRELETRLQPMTSFAYPFGRRWDWDKQSQAVVRAAGFETATTTHAGTNTRRSDAMALSRWMIDDTTPLHMIACEACGGFELLRKLGLDLSEG